MKSIDNKSIQVTDELVESLRQANTGYLEIKEARTMLIQSITAYCEKLGMK